MPRSRCYAASPTSLPPSISSVSFPKSEEEHRTSQSVERRKREVAQASTPFNKHKVHNASRSGHIVTNQYPHCSPTLPPQCQSSKSGGEDRTSQFVERRRREVAQTSTPVNKHKVQYTSRFGHIATHQCLYLSLLPSHHPSLLLFFQCQPSESEGEDWTSQSGVRRKREAVQISTFFKKHKVQNAPGLIAT